MTSDKKTRKRMEDVAEERAKHRDSCSAKRVQTGPTSSTSFGMKAEPPALSRRDDVLVDKGAVAPKPCLSPVKMRTRTAAGDLLPAGLYSDYDHLLPAAYSVLPDRGDRVWDDINPVRHVQRFLGDEGLRNKIEANSGVRSWWLYRSSTRLPVFGSVARIALRGGV